MVVPALKHYQELGTDRFTCCASFGLDPARETRSFELIIEPVMPYFEGDAASGAAAPAAQVG